MDKIYENFPWIIIRLESGIHAISSRSVASIVILNGITSVPVAQSYIRGVINLRGKIIPCIDLRLLLGMESMTKDLSDFNEMLTKRESDHINWLNELKSSVNEKRPFKLTTDPHACAFGKWYDAYQSDDIYIGGLLRKFDEPHKRIHGIANIVKNFETEGNFTEAAKLIEKTEESDLKEMINLFSSVRQAYNESKREIVIIIESNEKFYGVIVDEIISIEELLAGSIEEINVNNSKAKVGKRKSDNSLVLLLGYEDILV